MLKSYDYVEFPVNRDSIQAPSLFKEELNLVRSAVARHVVLESQSPSHCIGCWSGQLGHFCTKWEVPYFRCQQCETVFAVVDDKTLENYYKDSQLLAYRSSKEYQEDATSRRSQQWGELLDWFRFRCARYLPQGEKLQAIYTKQRHEGFVNLLKESDICVEYEEFALGQRQNQGDMFLCLNTLHQQNKPKEFLQEVHGKLKEEGLLFLTNRMGTGFDILALRERAEFHPYDFVSLLSKEGLEALLLETGFEILDYATPGIMDVGFVSNHRAFLKEEDLFIKTLINHCDREDLGEFQRFLQRAGLSSYGHIVARKVRETS